MCVAGMCAEKGPDMEGDETTPQTSNRFVEKDITIGVSMLILVVAVLAISAVAFARRFPTSWVGMLVLRERRDPLLARTA